MASDAATSLSRSGYGRFRRPFGRSPITRLPSGRSPAEIASYPIASSATAAAEAKLAVFDTVRRRRKRLGFRSRSQAKALPRNPSAIGGVLRRRSFRSLSRSLKVASCRSCHSRRLVQTAPSLLAQLKTSPLPTAASLMPHGFNPCAFLPRPEPASRHLVQPLWNCARLFRTVIYFCSSGLVGTVPSYR